MQSTIKSYKIKVTSEMFDKLYYYVIRDFLGYGKIDILIRDPNVEDISVDGVQIPVFVWHKLYENLPTNVLIFGLLPQPIQKLIYICFNTISVFQLNL